MLEWNDSATNLKVLPWESILELSDCGKRPLKWTLQSSDHTPMEVVPTNLAYNFSFIYYMMIASLAFGTYMTIVSIGHSLNC